MQQSGAVSTASPCHLHSPTHTTLRSPCSPACAGFVLSSRFNPVPVVTYFDAQIAILELLEHKPILTGGYKAVLHLHSGGWLGGWGGAGGALRAVARAGIGKVGALRRACDTQQQCNRQPPVAPPACLCAVVEECEITKLLAVIDPKTKEKKKVRLCS